MVHPRMNTKLSTGSVEGAAVFGSVTRPTTVTRAHCFHLGGNVTAFGTEIQGWKLSEADYAGTLGLAREQKGNNDILALTKPEVPEAIHRALASSAKAANTQEPLPLIRLGA